MSRVHALLGLVFGMMGFLAFLAFGAIGTVSSTVLPVEDAETDAGVDDAAPDPTPPPTVTECHAKVLVYHHVQEHFAGESGALRALNVSPRAFERHLSYLKENDYSVIKMEQLVECMENGTPVPDKAVVLTFDDRWRTQYKNAYPLLLTYKMSATFYVPTEMNINICMTWDQMREMDAHGMTIASHSRVHPMLNSGMQDIMLEKELLESRVTLQKELGHTVSLFAYPYGVTDARVEKAARAAGYLSARTVNPGHVHTKADLLHMKAYGAPEHLQAFIKVLEK